MSKILTGMILLKDIKEVVLIIGIISAAGDKVNFWAVDLPQGGIASRKTFQMQYFKIPRLFSSTLNPLIRSTVYKSQELKKEVLII